MGRARLLGRRHTPRTPFRRSEPFRQAAKPVFEEQQGLVRNRPRGSAAGLHPSHCLPAQYDSRRIRSGVSVFQRLSEVFFAVESTLSTDLANDGGFYWVPDALSDGLPAGVDPR